MKLYSNKKPSKLINILTLTIVTFGILCCNLMNTNIVKASNPNTTKTMGQKEKLDSYSNPSDDLKACKKLLKLEKLKETRFKLDQKLFTITSKFPVKANYFEHKTYTLYTTITKLMDKIQKYDAKINDISKQIK